MAENFEISKQVKVVNPVLVNPALSGKADAEAWGSVSEALAGIPDALKVVGLSFKVYKNPATKIETDDYSLIKNTDGSWGAKLSSSSSTPVDAYTKTESDRRYVIFENNATRIGFSDGDTAKPFIYDQPNGIQIILATRKYVDDGISALVNSSPAALDTLKELAAALGNDANFSTTVTNLIAGKVSPPTGTGKFLYDANNGWVSFSVNNTLTSTSTTDALSAAQGKILNEKILDQITITTSTNITTATVGSITGAPQYAKLVNIDNGVNAITITLQAAADSGFFATYFKAGAGAVAFAVESGQTLVQLDGISVMNGAAGSMALVKRFGNTFYLRIYNA